MQNTFDIWSLQHENSAGNNPLNSQLTSAHPLSPTCCMWKRLKFGCHPRCSLPSCGYMTDICLYYLLEASVLAASLSSVIVTVFRFITTDSLEIRRWSGWIFVLCWRRSSKMDITTLKRHYSSVSKGTNSHSYFWCSFCCVRGKTEPPEGAVSSHESLNNLVFIAVGKMCSQQQQFGLIFL